MKVLHVLADAGADQGGLSGAVAQLAAALAARGIESPVMAGPLDEAALAGVELVHIHGLWRPLLWRAQAKALRMGLPVVLSPHGMLEPWSLRQKALKKRLALALVQGPLLRRARLHATSTDELEHLSELGYAAELQPLGVALPPRPKTAWSGPRRLLFLSRLHPKKGLAPFFQAMVMQKERLVQGGWKLTVAGWDEGGHEAELRRLAQSLGLADRIDFVGPLLGEAKWKAFRQSDLFVLPTRSENYGMVVAEALGMGLPILTTVGAPWPLIEASRCGWRGGLEAHDLAQALGQALGAGRPALKAMGARGRQRILKDYGWGVRAGGFAAMYERAVKRQSAGRSLG